MCSNIIASKSIFREFFYFYNSLTFLPFSEIVIKRTGEVLEISPVGT